MGDYQFTNNWFEGARDIWNQLIRQINPRRVLEIGSFEGRSTCYLIENLTAADAEIHCVDSFEGGIEHREGGYVAADMSGVEKRFRHNIAIAQARAQTNVTVSVHRGYSDIQMAGMLTDGKAGYFDFVYVDGSHQAADVLCDAVLAFRLVRVGGLIGFDDYIWQELDRPLDTLRCPKTAIDAFVNIYRAKLGLVPCPNAQVYVQKIAE